MEIALSRDINTVLLSGVFTSLNGVNSHIEQKGINRFSVAAGSQLQCFVLRGLGGWEGGGG